MSDKPIPQRWQWCYDECLKKEMGVFTRALIEDLGEAEAERDGLREQLWSSREFIVQNVDSGREFSAVLEIDKTLTNQVGPPGMGPLEQMRALQTKNHALVEALELCRDYAANVVAEYRQHSEQHDRDINTGLARLWGADRIATGVRKYTDAALKANKEAS